MQLQGKCFIALECLRGILSTDEFRKKENERYEVRAQLEKADLEDSSRR